MTPEAVRLAIQKLPPDDRVDVEERAAILEYDGGMTKIEAERYALKLYQKEQAIKVKLFGVEG